MQPISQDGFPRFLRWDLTKLRTAMENLTMKDLTSGQVRGRPITPTQLEVEALSPVRMSQPNICERTRSTGRTKQTNTKSPNKIKAASDVVEPDAGFTTPVVQANDDYEFDIDEVPITKLDFSNISMNVSNDKSTAPILKSIGKGKTVMSYDKKLEERERKLESAEKILQRREHAVDIKLEKLEEHVLESATENERLKRLCAEQAKIIKKLEVERMTARPTRRFMS